MTMFERGFQEFSGRVRMAVPPGTVLDNPGGGTTTILSYDGETLRYRRGRSRFGVSLRDLYRAADAFRGQRITSAKLQRFAPEVFDSRRPHFGHSCNCTVLYMLLQQAGYVVEIGGAGVRGNPFFVELPE